jgi:glucose-6-phosphate 1-dehydrogenase
MQTLVILGASGDLTRRLLLPALAGLDRRRRLGSLRVVGYSLESWDDATFVGHVQGALGDAGVTLDAGTWRRFAGRLAHRHGDLSAAALRQLRSVVDGDAVFYLALPPDTFAAAAAGLAGAGLNDAGGARRLVVEKPFGTDLASAEALNVALHRYWREDQIFRIDHFLGKETVQNLMVVRFANSILEPLLHADYVDQVQITVAETLGLEGRYRYYDGIGALRDMLQNHLMQLFCLAAMDPPAVWETDVLRDHKLGVLKATRPLTGAAGWAARGQYTAGSEEGRSVPGYLEEPGIPAGSATETFAALKLVVDSWRWRGVPFYLRSGKRLAADVSEIAFRFREPPTRLFALTPLAQAEPNWLVFRLNRPEGIDVYLQAKEPGLELRAGTARLHTDYGTAGDETSAYEQLLLDALDGDHTPFLRFDEVEWAWRLLEPVLAAWRDGRPCLYPAGTEGPSSQDDILEAGHHWRPIARPGADRTGDGRPWPPREAESAVQDRQTILAGEAALHG